jgi:hypothetical protein
MKNELIFGFRKKGYMPNSKKLELSENKKKIEK